MQLLINNTDPRFRADTEYLKRVMNDAEKHVTQYGDVAIWCALGDTVADAQLENPAHISCGVVVSLPNDIHGADVVGWCGAVSSNNATHAGAAVAAIGSQRARALFDARYGAETRKMCREWILQRAYHLLHSARQEAA